MPTAPPAYSTPADRLTDVARPPSRTASSDDTSAALLQKIVPLPKMRQSELPDTLGRNRRATQSGAAVPVDRAAKSGEDAAYAAGDEAAQKPGARAGPDVRIRPILRALDCRVDGQESAAENTRRCRSLCSPPARPTLYHPDPRGCEGEPADPRCLSASRRPESGEGGTKSRWHGRAEAAVKAALKWLADNQSADGHWDARSTKRARTPACSAESAGAGQPGRHGHDRTSAGVPRLGPYAFDGPYREDVRRGLEYLLGVQATDGNLGGSAATFELMYCHAMATWRRSEAYGMTHDPRCTNRCVAPSVIPWPRKTRGAAAARLRPGDPGDTSQLGWQLMALKNATLAGIPMPETTRQGVIRYLQSVASGQYAGLSCTRRVKPSPDQ